MKNDWYIRKTDPHRSLRYKNTPANTLKSLEGDECTRLDLFSWRISTPAFRMVIKRYRQDPKCIKPLDIISKASNILEDLKYYKRSSTEKYRIVGGSLLQQEQIAHMLNIPLPLPPPDTTYKPRWYKTENEFWICPHI